MTTVRSSRDEILQVALNFFAAVNAHDVDKLRRLFDPGCQFNDPAATSAYDLEGFIELHREYYDRFPDLEWETLHLLVEERTACCVYRCAGTGSGEWPPGNDISGKPHEMVEVCVVGVEDSRIVNLSFHIDLAELARQPFMIK